VCVRGRENVSVGVCLYVCMFVREVKRVCVRERERERENVSVGA